MQAQPEEGDREMRIVNEAVVDAHNGEERAMGWYYYLDDKIEFPFIGKCRTKVSTSPLVKGEEVRVVSMAGAHVCDSDMFVTVSWEGRRIDVPLSQIAPVEATEDSEEAILDWHYWIGRCYSF